MKNINVQCDGLVLRTGIDWVHHPHLFLLRLQRSLQDISELNQLLPLSILSLFDLINTETSCE